MAFQNTTRSVIHFASKDAKVGLMARMLVTFCPYARMSTHSQQSKPKSHTEGTMEEFIEKCPFAKVMISQGLIPNNETQEQPSKCYLATAKIAGLTNH